MGRFFGLLVLVFVDFVGIGMVVLCGGTVFDVGCGLGAFTVVFVDRLGLVGVAVVDSLPFFVVVVCDRFLGFDVW